MDEDLFVVWDKGDESKGVARTIIFIKIMVRAFYSKRVAELLVDPNPPSPRSVSLDTRPSRTSNGSNDGIQI